VSLVAPLIFLLAAVSAGKWATMLVDSLVEHWGEHLVARSVGPKAHAMAVLTALQTACLRAVCSAHRSAAKSGSTMVALLAEPTAAQWADLKAERKAAR
jgi:hypothetical protein